MNDHGTIPIGTRVFHVDQDGQLWLGTVSGGRRHWAETNYPNLAPYVDVGYSPDAGPFQPVEIEELEADGEHVQFIPVRQLYPVGDALRNAARTVMKGSGLAYSLEAALLEHLAKDDTAQPKGSPLPVS